MDNIAKEYFGNKVLKGVQLHVAPGEIHALMGENGAGKSTLMNILFGMPVIHTLHCDARDVPRVSQTPRNKPVHRQSKVLAPR